MARMRSIAVVGSYLSRGLFLDDLSIPSQGKIKKEGLVSLLDTPDMVMFYSR